MYYFIFLVTYFYKKKHNNPSFKSRKCSKCNLRGEYQEITNHMRYCHTLTEVNDNSSNQLISNDGSISNENSVSPDINDDTLLDNVVESDIHENVNSTSSNIVDNVIDIQIEENISEEIEYNTELMKLFIESNISIKNCNNILKHLNSKYDTIPNSYYKLLKSSQVTFKTPIKINESSFVLSFTDRINEIYKNIIYDSKKNYGKIKIDKKLLILISVDGVCLTPFSKNQQSYNITSFTIANASNKDKLVSIYGISPHNEYRLLYKLINEINSYQSDEIEISFFGIVTDQMAMHSILKNDRLYDGRYCYLCNSFAKYKNKIVKTRCSLPSNHILRKKGLIKRIRDIDLEEEYIKEIDEPTRKRIKYYNCNDYSNNITEYFDPTKCLIPDAMHITSRLCVRFLEKLIYSDDVRYNKLQNVFYNNLDICLKNVLYDYDYLHNIVNKKILKSTMYDQMFIYLLYIPLLCEGDTLLLVFKNYILHLNHSYMFSESFLSSDEIKNRMNEIISYIEECWSELSIPSLHLSSHVIDFSYSIGDIMNYNTSMFEKRYKSYYLDMVY